MNNGYFHVQLDKESLKLTTFETPNGCYRFKRLPFGLSCSSEIFQKKLNQCIVGLKGIGNIADDILVHGRNVKEHDENLRIFLQRCRDTGIKLNKEKTVYNSNTINFMGHCISENGIEVDPEKVEAIKNFLSRTM